MDANDKSSILDAIVMQSASKKSQPFRASFAGRQRRMLPVSIVAAGWRTLMNIGTHREVARLLKAPALKIVVQNNPKFALKYLTDQYLVMNLTVAERAACFRHHYTRLQRELPDLTFRQILSWAIELCEFSENGIRFSLSLGLSRPCDKEGELSILLMANGEAFYTLSFTLVSGWVLRSPRSEVLLISRLQGTPGYPPETTKLLAKSLHRQRFGSLLLAALEGIATALGVEEISCVCSDRNISYDADYAHRFKSAYEDFFSELGIGRTEAGFFSTPVPIKEGPLEEVKHSHKSRARKQREIKQKVRSACTDYFLKAAARAKDEAEAQVFVIAVTQPQTGFEEASPSAQDDSSGTRQDDYPSPNRPSSERVTASGSVPRSSDWQDLPA